MCDSNTLPCINGICIPSNHTCRCELYFDGKLCNFKRSVWQIEAAETSLILLFISLVGLSIQRSVVSTLFFQYAKLDFVFPRTIPSEENDMMKGAKRLVKPEGKFRWLLQLEGPVEYTLPREASWLKVFGVLFAYLFSLLEWTQMLLIAFLPVVPWPTELQAIKKIATYMLLWREIDPLDYKQFSLTHMMLAGISIPSAFLIFIVLSLHRCPLLKPQPKKAPREDFCSLFLHLYCEAAVIPVLVLLFMPWRCPFNGFQPSPTSSFGLPDYLPECWNLTQGLYVVLGTACGFAYWAFSLAATIQLNSDATNPVPTFWSDWKYFFVHHFIKCLLALNIVAFGKTNPFALLGNLFVAAGILLYLNYRLRPSIYALVNSLRSCFCWVILWTSAIGFVLAFLDTPTNNQLVFIWVIGAGSVLFLKCLWFGVHKFKARRGPDINYECDDQGRRNQLLHYD